MGLYSGDQIFCADMFLASAISRFSSFKAPCFFRKNNCCFIPHSLGTYYVEEISHGTYFFIKQIFIKREFGEYVKNDLPYAKAIQITKNEILKGNRVIVCSNSLLYTNICSLSGSSSINDLEILNKKILTSRPVTIITIINQKEQPIIQDFIVKTNTKLEYQTKYEGGTLLYYITNFPKTIDGENLPDHTRIQ